MQRGTDNGGDKAKPEVPLCASCDRCRARKTKCDGDRPCGNCATKYMKRTKTTSIEGVPLENFDCVYSPAKRRGPQPGSARGESKKSIKVEAKRAAPPAPIPSNSYDSYGGGDPRMLSQQQPSQIEELRQIMLAQQQQNNMGYDQGWGGIYDGMPAAQQQQALRQLDQLSYLNQLNVGPEQDSLEQPASQRLRMDQPPLTQRNAIADTITAHLHMVSRNDIDGNRIRSYYRLSVDELFSLPVIPTDEEYFACLNMPVPSMIPKGLQNALLAARFSELALGALAHDEVALAMELCNATVHCLRKCVEEPVEQSYLFEVSRAYFLLGVFRAFRGDLDRYLKYRRVCLTHLSQLQEEENPVDGCEALLAAISYLDAWAYMMHNANESSLPDIDETIPPVLQQSMSNPSSSMEKKYDVMTSPACIAADPKNQVWIQGAPPVYLNNEAPLPARSLDALSCAVRSCCDQANTRFESIEKEANEAEEGKQDHKFPDAAPLVSPTATAVLSHQDELCARNMVLSAFTLLQQHEASDESPQKNQGQHLIISAMDAFLENGDEDGSGGFTDSQIQSLLSVCNTVIENPLLLHHAGPTYHMVSNAAILLCHLLNGMHAMKDQQQQDQQNSKQDMESAVFEEILDTFLSVRKLLLIYRRKLPIKLRCHGIPRNSVSGPEPGKAFIDLGETLMCACRGCQGFVLMACSPCVAAERARKTALERDMEVSRAAEMAEAQALETEIMDMGAEFDLDDDVLLNMLSRIITA